MSNESHVHTKTKLDYMMHVVSSQAQITLCEAVAKVSKSHTVPIVKYNCQKNPG